MEILHRIGYAVCHQISERTIFIDGKQLPVCARDTGLYLGSLISLLFILLTKRRKSTTIPTLPLSLSFVFFFFLMGLDALTSYTGLRNTTNNIRLITGLLSGLGFPFFLYPILRDNIIESEKDIVVLKNWIWFVLLLLLSAVTFLLLTTYNTNLFLPVAILIIIGIISLHYILVCTFLSVFIYRSTPMRVRTRSLIIFPSGIIILVIEFFILTKLHNLVSI
jgi:uncharacterized membrane protein